MAVSINSFGATLGKVAFGNAGVPKALGTIGRSMAKREGGSIATTALGRLYRQGGVYGVGSAFARRGATGAMIGAGVGAAVGVGSQLSQNRSYGDGAMNGVFGAALRGGLTGGALGMAFGGMTGFGSGKRGFSGVLRQGGARSMPWYRSGAQKEVNSMINDVLAGGGAAQARRSATVMAQGRANARQAMGARATAMAGGAAGARGGFGGIRSLGYDRTGGAMKSYASLNSFTRGSGGVHLSF